MLSDSMCMNIVQTWYPVQHAVLDWESRLSLVADVVEQWMLCQRNWLYLETIFSTADIQRSEKNLWLTCSVGYLVNGTLNVHISWKGNCQAWLLVCGCNTLILVCNIRNGLIVSPMVVVVVELFVPFIGNFPVRPSCFSRLTSHGGKWWD